MIKLDEDHILFIEPTGARSAKPVEDEITKAMRKAFKDAKAYRSYLGFHQCTCGARSDNSDWLLSSGQFTNSLALHYLRYHRKEVPQSELAKIKALLTAPISPEYLSSDKWMNSLAYNVEEQQVLAINSDLITALEERDSLIFDRCVREDTIFVGGFMTRADTKTKVRQRDIETSSYPYAVNKIYVNSVQVHENTAVVTGRISISMLSDEENRNGMYAFINVFIKSDSCWRLLSATMIELQ